MVNSNQAQETHARAIHRTEVASNSRLNIAATMSDDDDDTTRRKKIKTPKNRSPSKTQQTIEEASMPFGRMAPSSSSGGGGGGGGGGGSGAYGASDDTCVLLRLRRCPVPQPARIARAHAALPF
jgi:hypothetical protein